MRPSLRLTWAACLVAAAGFLAVSSGESRGAQAPPAKLAAEGEEGMISINLTGEVDLQEFLRYVSRSTGKRFMYDDQIRPRLGKVTFLGPARIHEDGLFSLLEAMLEYKNLALEPVGDILIKIRSATDAGTKPMPVFLPGELDALPDTDRMITYIYKMRHLATNVVQSVIMPLIGTGKGALVTLQQSDVLIITDYARNVKRLVRFLEMMDSEDNVPRPEIRTLEYANAEILGRQLNRLVAAESAALGLPKGRQPQVDFDIATNSLILLAVPRDMERLMELIDSLDVEADGRGRTWRMYRLKNAKAVDVAATLKALVQETPSGVRAAGARPVRAGAGQPQQPTAAVGILAAAEVRVIEYEAQNAIIIVAPRDVQAEMEELIDELDVFKPQVLIEALVVQVSTGADLDIGTELAYWEGDEEYGGIGVSSFDFSEYDFETGERTINAGLGLAGVLVHKDQVPILLRALLIENDGKILSRPVMLANDNAEATFESLDAQPFTSVNTLTSTTATTSFGGFEEAGTKLIITPHISEGDYLGLEIEIELSQFTGVAPSPSVPPAKRSDRLQTNVTVPDDSTIVIGGLSGYHSTRTVSKVPILGDIPLLGALFRRTLTIYDDSTEYIFIRARIARDAGFGDLLEMSREPRDRSRELERTMKKGRGDLLREAIIGPDERAERAERAIRAEE